MSEVQNSPRFLSRLWCSSVLTLILKREVMSKHLLLCSPAHLAQCSCATFSTFYLLGFNLPSLLVRLNGTQESSSSFSAAFSKCARICEVFWSLTQKEGVVFRISNMNLLVLSEVFLLLFVPYYTQPCSRIIKIASDFHRSFSGLKGSILKSRHSQIALG